MSDSYVLGINVSHDISAALIRNGQLVCAIAEERLNRIKRYTGGIDQEGMTNKHVPHLAVHYCLSAAGISFKELSLIVVSSCVVVNYENYRIRALTKEEILVQLPADLDPAKVVIVGHHIGHAASVYYPSVFTESVILVSDGGGSLVERESNGKKGLFEERVTLYHGQGDRINILKQYFDGQPSQGFLANLQHASLGDFYQSATFFVGFKGGDEGKTMGLAPYGSEKYFKMFEDAISMDNGTISIASDFQFNKWKNKNGQIYGGQLGARRRAGEPLRGLDQDVSAAVQHAIERALIKLARDAYALTGSKNLCLSGGVALNSVANKKILDETPFKNVFIQPAAGDDGCAIGNALLGWVDILGQKRAWTMRNAYTGRTYSQEEIDRAIEEYHGWVSPVTRAKDVIASTGRLIADGKIVGWFQGGSEFGPRALGHRSILCDARDGKMKDILNSKVKHREPFRPFAPSILKEFNSEYFELDCDSPFMLLVAQVKKPEAVPAITHVDNSARVQTITREDNGVFYDLIKSYYELTGVPVILNTSFNVDGEPIVETPQDAIRCFLGTHMDYLVLGDVILAKSELKSLVFKTWPQDVKRAGYHASKILASRFPLLKKFKEIIGKKPRDLKHVPVKVPG